MTHLRWVTRIYKIGSEIPNIWQIGPKSWWVIKVLLLLLLLLLLLIIIIIIIIINAC